MNNVWQLGVSIGLVNQVIEFVQSVKDVGFKVVEPGPLGSLTHKYSSDDFLGVDFLMQKRK